MRSIQRTKEVIKFYEEAIKNAQKLIQLEIENDHDFQQFRKKINTISPDYEFIFYDRTLQFGMYKIDYTGDKHQITDFFEIDSNGEIVFDEVNRFEGIEEVAVEAQKIVSKFL
jgi:hypothetical protein